MKFDLKGKNMVSQSAAQLGRRALGKVRRTVGSALGIGPVSDRAAVRISDFGAADLDGFVAKTDALCAGSSGWETCPGVPVPYRGFGLRYRGTEIDQCGLDKLSISSVHGPVPVDRGGAAVAEVSGARFQWFCGGSQESTSAKDGVDFVIAKWGLTDRQIVWDTYTITSRPQPPPPPNGRLSFSDTTLNFRRVKVGTVKSQVLTIANTTGHSVTV